MLASEEMNLHVGANSSEAGAKASDWYARSCIAKLVLGTVQFGLDYGINNYSGKVSEENSHQILREASAAGIRYLDTAESYGTAHEVIGNFHRSNTNQRFNVITKIPAKESVANVAAKVEQYLQQLHVVQLGALMFHSFSTYSENKNIISELKSLQLQGMFQQLGVSVYTNNELKAVIDDADIDLIQLPFNLLDNASLRGELIHEAKSKGKIVHTRSAFLQGLFFKVPSDEHPVAKALTDQLAAIRTIAQAENISIAQLALAYALWQPCIDNVLIGVDTVEQLRCNLAAAGCRISTQAVQRINSIQTKDIKLLNPSLWKEYYS